MSFAIRCLGPIISYLGIVIILSVYCVWDDLRKAQAKDAEAEKEHANEIAEIVYKRMHDAVCLSGENSHASTANTLTRSAAKESSKLLYKRLSTGNPLTHTAWNHMEIASALFTASRMQRVDSIILLAPLASRQALIRAYRISRHCRRWKIACLLLRYMDGHAGAIALRLAVSSSDTPQDALAIIRHYRRYKYKHHNLQKAFEDILVDMCTHGLPSTEHSMIIRLLAPQVNIETRRRAVMTSILNSHFTDITEVILEDCATIKQADVLTFEALIRASVLGGKVFQPRTAEDGLTDTQSKAHAFARYVFARFIDQRQFSLHWANEIRFGEGRLWKDSESLWKYAATIVSSESIESLRNLVADLIDDTYKIGDNEIEKKFNRYEMLMSRDRQMKDIDLYDIKKHHKEYLRLTKLFHQGYFKDKPLPGENKHFEDAQTRDVDRRYIPHTVGRNTIWHPSWCKNVPIKTNRMSPFLYSLEEKFKYPFN